MKVLENDISNDGKSNTDLNVQFEDQSSGN